MSELGAALSIGEVTLVGPEPLAQGRWGEVWRGLSAGGEGTPRLVVCKLTRPWVIADGYSRRCLLHCAAVRAALACDAAPRHVGAWEFDAGDGVGVAIVDEHAGDLRLFDVARVLAAAGPGARLPAEVALYVASQIARLHGAARALGGGVELACDPNDVLLDWDGRVRVAVTPRPPADAGLSGLRGPSEPAGDFDYLAPERVRNRESRGGEPWAVGVQLYELLTGRHPFRQKGALETIGAILKGGAPPLVALRPDVDPAVSELVDRCLWRDPKARPRLGPLVAALEEALRRVGASPTASLAGLLSRALPERRAEALALRSRLAALSVDRLRREAPALSVRRITAALRPAGPPPAPGAGAPAFAPGAGAHAFAPGTGAPAFAPGAAPDLDGATTVAPDFDAEPTAVAPDFDAEPTAAVAPDFDAEPTAAPDFDAGPTLVSDLDGETTAVAPDLDAETVAITPGLDADATLVPPLGDRLGDDGRLMLSVRPGILVDLDLVSGAAYAAFVRATGRPPPGGWLYLDPPAALAGEPVTGVSHEDAGAYARWAGKRLPTDAEWQLAVDVVGRELRGLGKVWEWTSSGASGVGYVVRGGRFRGGAGAVAHPANSAFEWQPAPDVGFRCVAVGARPRRRAGGAAG